LTCINEWSGAPCQANSNTRKSWSCHRVEAMHNTTIPSLLQISPEVLAHLGDGQIAYVKPIRSEDVSAMFPQVTEFVPGLKLFALHAADGTPIMVTDTREAAVANARSQELQTVGVACRRWIAANTATPSAPETAASPSMVKDLARSLPATAAIAG
jgi:hypothetical protein